MPPFPDLVEWLRERLERPLPGLPAQLEMAPPVRGSDEDALRARAETCRKAAVLILLFPDEAGECRFVLTLRQRALQVHSGQVSLPGGSLDADETPTDAALREAREEVGVGVGGEAVIGTLTELYIPPSHFCVTPVVAAVGERPDFRRQKEEVAAIVEAPLGALLDPEDRDSAVWHLHGQDVRVPFYRIGGHEVWGATAMMLAELASILGETSVGDRA